MRHTTPKLFGFLRLAAQPISPSPACWPSHQPTSLLHPIPIPIPHPTNLHPALPPDRHSRILRPLLLSLSPPAAAAASSFCCRSLLRDTVRRWLRQTLATSSNILQPLRPAFVPATATTELNRLSCCLSIATPVRAVLVPQIARSRSSAAQPQRGSCRLLATRSRRTHP